MDYKIFWTQQAIKNLEEILNYLTINWTEKEVIGFKRKLSKRIELIQRFPRMFPVSSFNPRLRKAVLSKQTTIFYELKENVIYLVFIWVNTKDPNQINY